VRAGLVAAEQLPVDMAVFTTVDTPDIPADAVRRTLHAAGESGVARASYAGRPGHPVVPQPATLARSVADACRRCRTRPVPGDG
jgi:CTP:molybdopterin cytidylyltransferase MocA